MKNLKVKIIVGFRRDQEHTIEAEEAHKAYYLFLHPEQRGVFSNGLALIGSDIKEIVPDYVASMGWNPGYNLGPEDWNEIRDEGVSAALSRTLGVAKQVAQIGEPAVFNLTLSEAIQKYPQLQAPSVDRREGATKQIGEIIKENKQN